MFKLWSDIKKGAKNELKPNLGLRAWSDLDVGEKSIMWQHMEWYFFDKTDNYDRESGYFKFFGGYPEIENKKKRIFLSIDCLNELYKAKNFAPTFLEDPSLEAACSDFYNIFINNSENVVFELLSFYSRALVLERSKNEPYRDEGESDKDFEKRTKEWRFSDFDDFAKKFNEVLESFGVNVLLTRTQFVPRQDSKITKGIYEPVLESLSDSKWEKVNEHLSDSFKYFQTRDYGNVISNSVSAIQAFLQISVNGKVGKGNIAELISKGQTRSIIPNDVFSKTIFNNIESIFARERQEKSGVHPKLKKADENSARLILNLAMVFIQHCIQK
jgi:hypothetical protein